jgi:two-component system, sensor histidine kinase YesM
MNIKNKTKIALNKLSLKTQLTALITITVAIIIITIISYNYRRSINTILSQQISTTAILLKLETQNLDSYLSEIDRYSLQLRNDERTLQSFNTRKPLSYSDSVAIQSQIKSSFYSRSDLLSYRLYLLNQSEYYEMTVEKQRIRIFQIDSLLSIPEYKLLTKENHFRYILPGNHRDAFFLYYRAIINIEDQSPIAIVELTFDTSYISSLAKNHSNDGEILCMIDKDGQLLFSNNDKNISEQTGFQLDQKINEQKNNHFIIELNGISYLAIYHLSFSQNYKIVILNPLNQIDQQVNKTRNISILLGLISISVSAAFAITFINLVTTPLSKLSHRLKKVGKGNFKITANIGGSREIVQLAENYNEMIHQIDELITKNYIAELNEKTARLTALEAQINPHFLYNTLQAVSAEAIVNDQPQINAMITSLASMLRYTIKGGDLVMLKEEIKHVQDYLVLQHARFGKSLTYEFSIDPETLDLLIPKISIQVLVENAILHGIGGEKTSVHIQIESIKTEDTIIIKVTDNGIGITKAQLDAIYHSFSLDFSKKSVNSSIGLSNLYHRLKILYGENAVLSIDSIPGEVTTVSFTITRKESVEDV